MKAGRKPGDPQNAHRVFAKGIGHVAQQFGRDVALAAIGVDQIGRGQVHIGAKLPGRPIDQCAGSHGVDGQVAPRQVLFQRDIRRRMHRKAVIAFCGFALGAGQGVFFFGRGVKEHRKVFADRQKAACHQFFRRAAHHHPFAVLHGQAQQGIANRTTDHENFHGGSLAVWHVAVCLKAASGTALQNPESRFQAAHRRSTPSRLLWRTACGCKR